MKTPIEYVRELCGDMDTPFSFESLAEVFAAAMADARRAALEEAMGAVEAAREEWFECGTEENFKVSDAMSEIRALLDASARAGYKDAR